MPAHLLFYADAFWRLSNDRPIGMGVGPIPFVSLDAFARRFGIEGDAFDRFQVLIRAQDTEYLQIRNRRSDDKVRDEVTSDDTEGVKSLLQRLAAKNTDPEQSESSSSE